MINLAKYGFSVVEARAPQAVGDNVIINLTGRAARHHIHDHYYIENKRAIVRFDGLKKYLSFGHYKIKASEIRPSVMNSRNSTFGYKIYGLNVYDNVTKEIVSFVGQVRLPEDANDWNNDKSCSARVHRVRKLNSVYAVESKSIRGPKIDAVDREFWSFSKDDFPNDVFTKTVSIPAKDFYKTIVDWAIVECCKLAIDVLASSRNRSAHSLKFDENFKVPATVEVAGFMFRRLKTSSLGYTYISSRTNSTGQNIRMFRFSFDPRHPKVIDFNRRGPNKNAWSTDASNFGIYKEDGSARSLGDTHWPINLKVANPTFSVVCRFVGEAIEKHLAKIERTSGVKQLRFNSQNEAQHDQRN